MLKSSLVLLRASIFRRPSDLTITLSVMILLQYGILHADDIGRIIVALMGLAILKPRYDMIKRLGREEAERAAYEADPIDPETRQAIATLAEQIRRNRATLASLEAGERPVQPPRD